ncbi:MAG: Rieske 2Fe-2S domain-containing protein [Gemmatimonadaceae bacterium]
MSERISNRNTESKTACESCSRRRFVSESVMAAVASLLFVACGDGVIGAGGGSGITGPLNITVTLSDYSALGTVGGIAKLTGTSTPIAIVRSADATYLAFSMVCPHQGTTININGSGFLCPNHGAQFNAGGTWAGGQPTNNLVRISTTLDATAGTLTLGSVT